MSKKVAVFPGYSIASLVVTQLKDFGLSPHEIDYAFQVSVAGADQFYYIKVNENEADKARGVLKDLGHESKLI